MCSKTNATLAAQCTQLKASLDTLIIKKLDFLLLQKFFSKKERRGQGLPTPGLNYKQFFKLC